MNGVLRGTFLWCAALVVLLSTPASGQQADAQARVDSTRWLVGDAIPVHVRITHPVGATIRPLFGDTVGAFKVLGSTPLTPEGSTTTVGNVVVAYYDSGNAILPPLQFLYTLQGDTAARTVSSNEVLLSISTVAIDTAQDIRDIKPPLSIPLTWWEILLYILTAAAVVGAGYLAYRLWKRWKERPLQGESALPARPAHVIALEELAVLREKKLWQQGRIKEYYTEVTEVLRRYLENRYRMMALERTSDEILDDLRRIRMTDDLLRQSDRLLRRADLVKFAKHLPGIDEHEESIKVVYDFVEKTKIVEQPVASEGGKEHVGA